MLDNRQYATSSPSTLMMPTPASRCQRCLSSLAAPAFSSEHRESIRLGGDKPLHLRFTVPRFGARCCRPPSPCVVDPLPFVLLSPPLCVFADNRESGYFDVGALSFPPVSECLLSVLPLHEQPSLLTRVHLASTSTPATPSLI